MAKWDDLRILEAVGRLGSFSAAAKDLDLTQSSVSRRMREFESQLGVRLFERQGSHILLSKAGRELFETAGEMASLAQAATRRLAGKDEQLSGSIRFTTVDATAFHLMPSIARFRAQHPDISVHVELSQGLANLSRSEADVVLRATNQPHETFLGKRVATHVFPVYAARSLLEQFEPKTSLAELPWVGWSVGLGQAWMQQHAPGARCVGTVNTAQGMIEAVRAGVGIGHLAAFGGDTLPELVRVADPCSELNIDLWLLTHPDLKRSARVQAFVRFLSREIEALRPLIEGHRPQTPGDSSQPEVDQQSADND